MSPATLAGAPAVKSSAPAVLVPFTRAAVEHTEQFADVSQILGASSVALGPFDVPAYGFMRGIVLRVTATGGTGTPTALEDAPFSALDEVTVLDVNGAPIVGPLTGYDLFLINKYGGYSYSSDPRQSPGYSAVSATGNFSFILRIPIELSARDALGSLANQNAASTYKLRLSTAPGARIYGTQPTIFPTLRVRAYLDAWTQPTANDLRGNVNATTPPANGTTGYWSKASFTVAAGVNTLKLPRMGNMLRNLIFIWRDATSRASADTAGSFPDPASLYWDTRLLRTYDRTVWQDAMQRKYDFTGALEAARGLDKGVFVEDYCHEFDGHVGQELRDGWLPTLQSTRYEIAGTFGAAGTLTVLTNDVAPAGDVYV